MNAKLLWKELNPKYDLDRNLYNPLSIKSEFQHVGPYVTNACKSIVRGGVVGATIGALAGTLSSLIGGGDVSEGAKFGTVVGGGLGAILDMVQYCYRWVDYHLKMEYLYSIKSMSENQQFQPNNNA